VNSSVLSWLIFLPTIGGLAILFTKKEDARTHRILATLFSALTFVLSVWMYPQFNSTTADMQFVQSHPWITAFNIHYHLGVDGLSFPLILLTTLLSLISVIASYSIDKRTKEYFFWFLLLETGMLGLFAALDFFLFYVFWEITLVPMYFLIGVWGGPKREYAAVKFFLFTLFGSVFMLLSMLAIYFASGTGAAGSERTFDLVQLAQLAKDGHLQLAGSAAMLVFLGL
jgi:NADH-quinone oxidoreductase subunit M